jgi:prephenate dehydratase
MSRAERGRSAPHGSHGPRVAYQGEPGAYGEHAALRRWGRSTQLVPVPTFGDVAHAVVTGAADVGLLPLENTIVGVIAASCELIAATAELRVVGEASVRVRHCLLAPAGATLAGIAIVESHPAALAQCRRFFDAHPTISPRAAHDTAGAARLVAARDDPTVAAIASRRAGERYGLRVLAEGIEDRPGNRTRFLAVTAPGAPSTAGAPLSRGPEAGAAGDAGDAGDAGNAADDAAQKIADGAGVRSVLLARWDGEAAALARLARRALSNAGERAERVAPHFRLRALTWRGSAPAEEPTGAGRALIFIDHTAADATDAPGAFATLTPPLESALGPVRALGSYAFGAARVSRSRPPSAPRGSP